MLTPQETDELMEIMLKMEELKEKQKHITLVVSLNLKHFLLMIYYKENQ